MYIQTTSSIHSLVFLKLSRTSVRNSQHGRPMCKCSGALIRSWLPRSDPVPGCSKLGYHLPSVTVVKREGTMSFPTTMVGMCLQLSETGPHGPSDHYPLLKMTHHHLGGRGTEKSDPQVHPNIHGGSCGSCITLSW